MSRINLSRPLTSYSKIQALIGQVIRNNKIFISKEKLRKLKYLDIGCGPNTSEDFVNLDYSWNPKIDICWNITKGNLPFRDNNFQGVFSEHCLEHIPFVSFKNILREIYRILKPGGCVRIVMPDGELYLDIYQKQKNGENIKMPYEEGYISPMARINGIFRNHGHQFIYDFKTVELVLAELGFQDIRKEKFRSGRDENLSKKDTEWRKIESLYIEAQK